MPDPPPIPPPPDNINIIAPSSYYASASGNRCLFIASVDYFPKNSSEVGFLALINPSGSGKILYIDRLHFSGVFSALVKAYRDATLSGGVAITPSNRTAWTGTSIAQVLGPSATVALNFTPTIASTKLRAFGAYGDLESHENGTLQVSAGHSLLWTLIPSGNNKDMTMDVIWWET